MALAVVLAGCKEQAAEANPTAPTTQTAPATSGGTAAPATSGGTAAPATSGSVGVPERSLLVLPNGEVQMPKGYPAGLEAEFTADVQPGQLDWLKPVMEARNAKEADNPQADNCMVMPTSNTESVCVGLFEVDEGLPMIYNELKDSGLVPLKVQVKPEHRALIDGIMASDETIKYRLGMMGKLARIKPTDLGYEGGVLTGFSGQASTEMNQIINVYPR